MKICYWIPLVHCTWSTPSCLQSCVRCNPTCSITMLYYYYYQEKKNAFTVLTCKLVNTKLIIIIVWFQNLILYLAQIQSPDFQPERPAANEMPRALEMSVSKAAPAPLMSSLRPPHLKQLERLAKLWAPQLPPEQYQSPGLTSGPVNPKEPPLPPKFPKSPLSPGLGSPHRWHESLLWKLRCWHDLQFQSPGLFIFPWSSKNFTLLTSLSITTELHTFKMKSYP